MTRGHDSRMDGVTGIWTLFHPIPQKHPEDLLSWLSSSVCTENIEIYTLLWGICFLPFIFLLKMKVIWDPCGETRSLLLLLRAMEGRLVIIENGESFVFYLCHRIVGGFETLTAMENVESDPKTDKPKVKICDIKSLHWRKQWRSDRSRERISSIYV